jgi:extracellular factor (EF) 3-hydroxypalmitic acid methyl ester biosynthesis protein
VKTKTYEQLSGGRGREMFYRAERFKAPELFKRGSPALTLARQSYALHDISISGLAAVAETPAHEWHTVGQQVDVRLAMRDEPVFEAKAEVVRVERTPRRTKVGVRFVDHGFSASQVVTRYQRVVTRVELDDCDSASEIISPDYRQLCADVLYMLRSYRSVLDDFETTRPDATASSEMLAACEERLLPRWHTLWRHGNLLVMSMDQNSASWRAAKRYTELVLTPDFIQGASWRRAYEKPLGYPGDFEVMNMAYNWRPEGVHLSERLVHRIGLEVGTCIATRMVIMRQAIAETVASAKQETVRIASLGCGPAREVIDYLHVTKIPCRIEFTLIDQDRLALSQAYERSLADVMRHEGRAAVSCVHASFAQLLGASALFGKFPKQDLIYSVGLIDYLTTRRASDLVHALYEHLAPGGRLIVGNLKSGPDSTLWPMEFICDWSLNYRSDDELMQFGAGLSGAELAVSQDNTGHVGILTVRKRP